MKKYCLHPGHVTSKEDGDRHYIGYDKLIQLWAVDPKECGLYRTISATHMGEMCLRPSYSGRYKIKSGSLR